jgi:quercetin dioxygenase-like cupin family protein
MFDMVKGVPKILIHESEVSYPGNDAALQSATPLNIIELANYEDDAIVSRTLSKSNCGTITLFSFDQGQGLSEHTSPFNALVQILEGNAEIFVSGKCMQANQGQIVILPANQPHALSAVSKFKMLLIMIRSG